MYFLLYGPDTFSMKEKVEAIEQKLINESGGDLGLLKINGASMTRADFIEAVLTVSLFSTKRLVEINNLMMENVGTELRKYIADNLAKIPASTIVLFIEAGLPDARTGLFKALNKPKQSQKFMPLEGTRLSAWIERRVQLCGGRISASARTKLESFAGADLWRLDQEIIKLISAAGAAGRETIEPEDVEKLVYADDTTTVFNFTDAVAAGNWRQALSVLHRLLTAGESEIKLLSMIVGHYRNMMAVKSLIDQGESQSAIPAKAGLHPYVVKKIFLALNQYPTDKIESIYSILKEYDLSVKTGRIEPALALDLLVVEICKR